MLLEISIRNIALIEELRMEFSPGFNVLTGETGAGKSIVVDSVNMALGARIGRDIIRTGTDKASVQALFERKNTPEIDQILEELGIEAEDELLVVTRELSTSGRNVCRVNGVVIPAGALKRITALLVDVHGQHEHQSLMNSGRHIGYLDAFGDAEHDEKIARVRELYGEYTRIRREIERLSLDVAERERRMDMLAFQIGEIDAVKPKPGEDEKLEQKNRLLENAEKIAAGIGAAYRYVYSGEGRSVSAQEALRRASDSMKGIASLDERFEALQGKLDELFYAAQDIGYELQDIQDGLEYDPERAARIADRLNELKRLKRKYGPELSDVIAFQEDAKQKLAELEDGDSKLDALREQAGRLEQALAAASRALTQSRRELADAFCRRMLAQLQDLGMGKTRFEVRFSPLSKDGGRFSSTGEDHVEFMLSPNPGEPLKPLSTIASGGELSRIMLALKAIAADADGVDSMIFDEIDTGISGRMAQVVGEKMASIAKKRQVICVTHLPQIAALANVHFLVEKTVVGGRTDSGVRRLDREGRIQELARMVGGAGDAASGLAHATHMLDAAQALASGVSS